MCLRSPYGTKLVVTYVTLMTITVKNSRVNKVEIFLDWLQLRFSFLSANSKKRRMENNVSLWLVKKLNVVARLSCLHSI